MSRRFRIAISAARGAPLPPAHGTALFPQPPSGAGRETAGRERAAAPSAGAGGDRAPAPHRDAGAGDGASLGAPLRPHVGAHRVRRGRRRPGNEALRPHPVAGRRLPRVHPGRPPLRPGRGAARRPNEATVVELRPGTRPLAPVGLYVLRACGSRVPATSSSSRSTRTVDRRSVTPSTRSPRPRRSRSSGTSSCSKPRTATCGTSRWSTPSRFR